jgi:2-phosphosulfolactate phosphatase
VSLAVTVERGPEGARAGAARGDVVVIVDVLSFATTMAIAVERGAEVVPCVTREEATARARELGAAFAAERGQPLSLSPMSWLDAPATLAVVRSPNGGACTLAARQAPAVLVGALVNARAVAREVARLGRPVSLVSCGEVVGEPGASGPPGMVQAIRPALEDDLGVGAILAALEPGELSFDGRACLETFRRYEGDLQRVLLESESGLELALAGFDHDVLFAGRLDAVVAVPVLRGDRLVRS